MDDIPRTRWYRALEIFPGAASWLILLAPIILAFWFPRPVAIFVILYVMLWFLRYVKSSVYFIFSFLRSKKYEKLRWLHLLDFFSSKPPHALSSFEKKLAEKVKFVRAEGAFKEWREIYHLVIIATYKEEKEILESTLAALENVEYPLDRLIVVLATEERDHERAQANAVYLTEKFSRKFGQFHHIMHPKNLPGEIAAKGANITYAGREMACRLKEQGIDFSDVIVTTLDADNRPHQSYFANLTYHYLIEPEREKRSFQPLPFFYNNIWDVPFINRVIALANTFWYLSESGVGDRLFNASAHAQSLDALVAMDFWSKETVVEDLHQFWRAYFHFKGNHSVIPLFVPIYQDALQNKTYFTSLMGQYKQLRRWAWGASEIPYAIMKSVRLRRELPFFRTSALLVYLCYLQITWATAPIIIYFNKSIPTLLNPEFGQSLFAYNLGYVINVMFTIVLIAIIISLSLSLLSLPRPPGRFAVFHYLSIFIHWLLIPFITITYGAIPAIDAQTRLMLGKKLGFSVTEKIRKIN